jgi:hypothetical protein
MHVRRGFLGWGVFLILTGAIPLLLRFGYLTSDQVGRLWNLWPLVIIGIGIGLILRRTPLDFVGGLIVAATLGLMAGGLLSIGSIPFSTGICGQSGDDGAFPTRDGTFAGPASVDLQIDCGDLTVGIGTGSAWRVEGQAADGRGPDIESTGESLSVHSPDASGSFPDFGRREVWRVTLPDAAPIDLDLRLNAGGTTADLGGARLGNVGLEANAGSATVDLGSVEAIGPIDATLNAGSLGLILPNLSMTGSIQANAGAVRLCAPPGVALRLHTGESLLGGYDYTGHGLVQDGSTWSTPGFDTAPVRIELDTAANIGSFKLDPEDGCG